MVLVSGHWKAEPSGAKEFCFAQMASEFTVQQKQNILLTYIDLLYLTTNLLKSSLDISLRDLLVACSCIGAISASVSMALSEKDVFAARSLVSFATLLHFPAFIAECIDITWLSRFESQCLADMRHPILNPPKSIMWIYFGIRTFATFAPTPTVWRLILRLDEIEHAPRRGSQVKEARTWETLPATLFTNCLVFASFALVQAALAFSITVESFAESRRRLVSEWGQSAALIVAGVAIVHVVILSSLSFVTTQWSDDFPCAR